MAGKTMAAGKIFFLASLKRRISPFHIFGGRQICAATSCSHFWRTCFAPKSCNFIETIYPLKHVFSRIAVLPLGRDVM
jgi:hypothetical protein